jgi:CelD/BcsL family acetyltransferase involved in cellulose biosynthesis
VAGASDRHVPMRLAQPELLAGEPPELTRQDPSTVTVATLTDAASFVRLESEWDALVRAMPRPSPYLLHGWLTEWWRQYGAGRELYVPIARRDGALVAALPLCLHERLGVRVLEFLGGGSSMLADLLLADGETPAVGRLLAERAAHADQHFADLFGLPAASRLGEALGPRRLRLEARLEAPVLDLAEGWEAIYRAKTSSRRRNLHRRRRRALGTLGTVEIAVARTDAELERALEHAFVIYERRWQGRPDASTFVTPRGKALERAAVRSLARLDVPRIVLLELDGRPIAFAYCFHLEGRLYTHKLAFDPAFGRYSPGTINVLDTIAAAVAEGVTKIEFLGGAERYKVELADGFEPLYEGVGLAGGATGALAAAVRLNAVRLRMRAKQSQTAQRLYYGLASVGGLRAWLGLGGGT